MIACQTVAAVILPAAHVCASVFDRAATTPMHRHGGDNTTATTHMHHDHTTVTPPTTLLPPHTCTVTILLDNVCVFVCEADSSTVSTTVQATKESMFLTPPPSSQDDTTVDRMTHFDTMYTVAYCSVWSVLCVSLIMMMIARP